MVARNLVLSDPALLRAAQPPGETAFVELFEAGDGWFSETEDPGQPTHYYAFQTTDLSGATLTDRGSGGQDGTVTGVIETGSVRSGDGSLDGTMTVPAGVLDFNNEDWTVGGWYTSTNNGGAQQVIGNRNGSGDGWHVRSFTYNTNQSFNFHIEDTAQSLGITQGIAQGKETGDHASAGLGDRILWDFGGWVFWAMAFENATGRLRVYVSNVNDYGAVLRYDNTNASLIGADFSGLGGRLGSRPDGGEGLGGFIDDVFVFHGSRLTQGQIAYIQNETKRGRLLV